MSTARWSAFEILRRVEDGVFSSVLLAAEEAGLQPSDRALRHELVLGVLFESEVRITLTKPPGADRVVEGGVHQVLIVWWLAEYAVARDECRSFEDRAHGKAGTQSYGARRDFHVGWP